MGSAALSDRSAGRGWPVIVLGVTRIVERLRPIQHRISDRLLEDRRCAKFTLENLARQLGANEATATRAAATLGFAGQPNASDTPEQHILLAATAMSVIPIVVLYAVMQRHLIRGIMEGAVKG